METWEKELEEAAMEQAKTEVVAEQAGAAVATPTDEQLREMTLDRAAQTIREIAAAIAIDSVAKLSLKPKDMLILRSDRLDQETIGYMADVLSLHMGFRVVILNLKKDEDIKVIEGGAPQVVAATPTDLLRFK
jgi:hypothetical protein